jgi:hypothetical protein
LIIRIPEQQEGGRLQRVVSYRVVGNRVVDNRVVGRQDVKRRKTADLGSRPG